MEAGYLPAVLLPRRHRGFGEGGAGEGGNPWRRHSSIWMLSPAQFERAWREKNDQEVTT
jgi:transposase InsO family protein